MGSNGSGAVLGLRRVRWKRDCCRVGCRAPLESYRVRPGHRGKPIAGAAAYRFTFSVIFESIPPSARPNRLD